MASMDRYVSDTAKINARRSIFPLNRRVATSYFHGYCHPIGVPIEVLPGDTWKAHLAELIEMSTPVRPIMDNIRFEADFFFVPKRVLFNKTKLFYGESETFGIATKVYEPTMSVAGSSSSPMMAREDLDSNLKASETFAAAFGLIYEDKTAELDDSIKNLAINTLPVRAFLKCWNEFYRDQNYQDQYKWDMDATGEVDEFAYLGNNAIAASSMLPKVNKDKDLYISILPWQQKGDPVTIGLTGDLEIDGDISIGPDDSGSFNFMQAEDGPVSLFTASASSRESYLVDDDTNSLVYSSGLKATHNLVGDLSSVTAVNINQLLYALAYQDFLARAAHYGTKYKEYIYSMFGTTIADATEDIPEYLGRQKLNININRVLSTVDQDGGLGEQGAYSVTGGSGELFNHSFTEPGYLVAIGYCKHQRTYSSGIDKVFLKNELLHYYQPPFANIGDVPVSSIENFAGGVITDLGFQEPWYEYKSLQDRVYGILNPLMPNSLAYWTLAERYTEVPTISDEFLQEDRTALIDALATGENGPDYIMDFEFRFEVTRVMPITSTGARLGVL